MYEDNRVQKGNSAAELAAQGWQLATVSSGNHLQRCLEAYRELGIEVYTEVVEAQECNGCTLCFTKGEPMIRIYTRRKMDR